MYIILYIPCRDKKEAKKISRLLLKARLVACVNCFPVSSCYWWQGKIEAGKEVVMIAKTRSEFFDHIVKLVEKNHSYQTPCVAALPIQQLNKKYAKWLDSELVL